jgi:hypothetical protein
VINMMGLEISTQTAVTVLVTLLAAGIPAAAIVWRSRKNSPESMAVVLSSSADYLIGLHTRLESLEARVALLERENRE